MTLAGGVPTIAVVETELGRAIEELYAVFGRYPLAARISYCSHCVDDEEALVLQRGRLRDLTAGDLERFSRKVMSTWGDEADFRHFLPRILELFATGAQPDGYLLAKTVSTVRCYGQGWPQDERDAVERYLHGLWAKVVSAESPPVRPREVLEGIAAHDHSVVPYLRRWEHLTGPAADLQLASFVCDLAGSSWGHSRYHQEMDDWLRGGFPARRLETAFLATTDRAAAGWFGEALERLELLLFEPDGRADDSPIRT